MPVLHPPIFSRSRDNNNNSHYHDLLATTSQHPQQVLYNPNNHSTIQYTVLPRDNFITKALMEPQYNRSDFIWLPFAFFERLWSKRLGANFGSNYMVVSSLFSGQSAQSTRMPCLNLSCNKRQYQEPIIACVLSLSPIKLQMIGSQFRFKCS